MTIPNIQEERPLKVCEEAPVELVVNDKRLLTFMCTPTNLKELAAGYLLSSGLIDSLEEVYALAACDDMRKLFVTVGKDISSGGLQLNTVLASSCGSGAHFNQNIYERAKNKSSLTIPLVAVMKLSAEMLSKAELYKKHGGIHCAALAFNEELIAISEDVGRHNAVDKVIGRGAFLGADFNNSMIISTGRVSTDMVLKAVNLGVPIVATRSIPTSLALELAEELGITIIGRAASGRPVLYSHSYRVKMNN